MSFEVIGEAAQRPKAVSFAHVADVGRRVRQQVARERVLWAAGRFAHEPQRTDRAVDRAWDAFKGAHPGGGDPRDARRVDVDHSRKHAIRVFRLRQRGRATPHQGVYWQLQRHCLPTKVDGSLRSLRGMWRLRYNGKRRRALGHLHKAFCGILQLRAFPFYLIVPPFRFGTMDFLVPAAPPCCGERLFAVWARELSRLRSSRLRGRVGSGRHLAVYLRVPVAFSRGRKDSLAQFALESRHTPVACLWHTYAPKRSNLVSRAASALRRALSQQRAWFRPPLRRDPTANCVAEAERLQGAYSSGERPNGR